METFSQSDSIIYPWIASYDLKYRLDSTTDEYQEEYFVLPFNDHQSAFQAYNVILGDSVMRTEKKDNIHNIDASSALKYASNFNEFLITDIDKKTVAVSNDFLLDKPINPEYVEYIQHGWKIGTEQKVIHGVKCTRADEYLFGRHWIAWFSTEYPMPFGPYKFFGLPGLIFRLEDDKEDYVYELHTIHKRPYKMLAQYFPNRTRVTKVKYLELYDRYHYTTAMFNSGISISSSTGRTQEEFLAKAEKALKERKKRENNPIELKP